MISTRKIALALLLVPLMAASRPPVSADEHEDVLATIATFRKKDPGIDKFFKGAVGYAVLPMLARHA